MGVSSFEGNRGLFSLAHDWRISRDATLKLDVEHYRKNVSEPATIVFNAAQGVPDPVDNRLNHAGEWQRYDAEATNVLLRSDINLNDTWALTLKPAMPRTRDRNFSTLAINDLATGASSLSVFYQRNQRFANTNARAEVVGALQTGAVAHELTFGLTSNARRFRGEGAPTVSGIAQNYYNLMRSTPWRRAPGRSPRAAACRATAACMCLTACAWEGYELDIHRQDKRKNR